MVPKYLTAISSKDGFPELDCGGGTSTCTSAGVDGYSSAGATEGACDAWIVFDNC